jgi:uncharacterized tellurite resistance protein B-like protein
LYHRYDAAMPLLNWLCLLFLVVSAAGSIAFAAVRGLRTWRLARRVSAATTAALDDVLRKGEEAEAKAAALNAQSARLESSVARLQESLAELAVLRAAYANARSTLSFTVPSK